MDARITKQRLGNLISYDWLKMLVTIVVFVLVLVLLFTMTATRPKNTQEYSIYAYTDLTATSSFTNLGDTLEERDALSYDILAINSESFAGNNYASATYSARRAAGQGTVMFITDNPVYETDDNGDYVLDEDGNRVLASNSELYNFAMGMAYSADTRSSPAVYDTQYYMQLCEEYLVQFFGDDWADSDALDGATTPEQSFSRLNDGDKRYKTEEQRAQGIADERERLLKLRGDYLAVSAAFEDGTFSHTVYEGTRSDGNGGTETYSSALGIDVGGLNGLKNLLYYTDSEGVRTTENVNLSILYNNYLDGSDLCFETVSFLRYLLDTYKE